MHVHPNRLLSDTRSVQFIYMHRSVINVLFVSRENSVRSLLAEACLRHLGSGRFRAYSCGDPSCLSKTPNKMALTVLITTGIPINGLCSKPWTDFTCSGAPKMDFVILLDDSIAHKHPAWPGQPETALWDYPEVSKKGRTGMNAATDMLSVLHSLRRRIELLISLCSKVRNRTELRHDLRDMAHI